MVHRAIAPTSTNAERQPKYWPRKVATGLPSNMAKVRPIITRATAPARWSLATMLDATTAAMPKYAPWGRPLMKRKATRLLNEGAKAVARLPRAYRAISSNSMCLRSSRAPRIASVGAPTITPSA
ncbi:hypothetical protein D3C80_794470 [compost metagenome]